MRDLSERQRDRESESQREMTGKRRGRYIEIDLWVGRRGHGVSIESSMLSRIVA
jgi:coproporphyrinogen III oxidase